jgi:hypothetical protein
VSFHHNQVYDVRRESGVNAASGGGRARIYANTFIDCVLYGIEIEGHDYYGGMSYIHAWDNLIIRSKWGIPVVDQCIEAKLHHNTTGVPYSAGGFPHGGLRSYQLAF